LADFSDRVTKERRSYDISSRLQRRARNTRLVEHGNDPPDLEDEDSDDDSDEAVTRRIARLQLEVEEVRSIVEKRNLGKDVTDKSTEDAAGVEKLTKALKTIQTSQQLAQSAHAKLVKLLDHDGNMKSKDDDLENGQRPEPINPNNPHIDSTTLVKIANFDSRLAALETSLGLSTIDISNRTSTSILPLLPTLSSFEKQLSLLTSTSAFLPDNDDVSSTSLIPNYDDKFSTLQSSIKNTAQSKSLSANVMNGSIAEDKGILTTSDVDSLRNVLKLLPTLTNLSPIIGPLLNRLRSLNLLHVDSARSVTALDELEKQQERTDVEIKSWKQGLEMTRQSIERAEGGYKENVIQVEKWIKELEARITSINR